MLLLDHVSIEAEKARRDFKLFLELAWPVIEPGTQFVPGWHIDAISLHLQAVAEGQIKRLLVNMPPRHAKSSLISVLWPVWMWLQDSSLRFLCGSYDMSLAVRDNRKCRLLIRSNWFQERYGHLFQLRRDQNQKENFENDHGGYRIATSVGGGTGKGGDILLIDDPHPIEQKKGMVRREAALEWFKDTWSTRLNDQQTGRMIVVGQRVHDQDLSGFILSGGAGEQWVHLNLPAEYEPGSACRTYLPTGQEFWSDPREIEGELLWPEKFPEKTIEKEKRVHGPLGFAALYQQRPVPAGGMVYKAQDRRFFTIDTITKSYLLQTPRGIKTVPIDECWNLAVIDLATSEKQTADYFCMETWAITPYRDALLLHILHDHLPFPEQQSQIYLIFQRYHHAIVAVEKVGYQLAMIQHLIAKGLPVKPFEPQSDKVTRSTTGSIFYSNGKAYHNPDMPELPIVEKELFTFPKAPNDDIADCHAMMALVVSIHRRPGVVSLDGDDDEEIDFTLSAEKIIDATVIAEEQKKAEQEKAEEEKRNYKPHEIINPFEWAAAHELEFAGGWNE